LPLAAAQKFSPRPRPSSSTVLGTVNQRVLARHCWRWLPPAPLVTHTRAHTTLAHSGQQTTAGQSSRCSRARQAVGTTGTKRGRGTGAGYPLRHGRRTTCHPRHPGTPRRVGSLQRPARRLRRSSALGSWCCPRIWHCDSHAQRRGGRRGGVHVRTPCLLVTSAMCCPCLLADTSRSHERPGVLDRRLDTQRGNIVPPSVRRESRGSGHAGQTRPRRPAQHKQSAASRQGHQTNDSAGPMANSQRATIEYGVRTATSTLTLICIGMQHAAAARHHLLARAAIRCCVAHLTLLRCSL
jgi:hypothetical protein